MPLGHFSNQILGLLGWLGITFTAALVGGLASAGAGAFYQQLTRPEWAPPAWLFGPVWSVLYLLMAVAAWLVWREHGFRGAGVALALFLVQLGANALWTWLFFRWHLGAVSVVEILILWVLILGTVIAFWQASRIAGVLLVPYLVWVTFAVLLNYAIWRLNSHLLA